MTQYTAMVTANAQPVVTTIQPELLPLVWLRTTLATTPSPRTIRRAVPRNSATRGDMAWRVRAESMVVLEQDVHARLWQSALCRVLSCAAQHALQLTSDLRIAIAERSVLLDSFATELWR